MSAGKRCLKLHADVHVTLPRLCPYDGTFKHAETCGCIGVKSGRNRHLDEYVFVGGYTLHCDQYTACAHVYCGSEFERVTTILICAVYEHRKGQGDTLPTSGLVLRLGHV